MANWRFLTNHARAMLFVARFPDARLRDIAAGLGVTERTVQAVLTDLVEAGFVVKERDGRRNRYHIQDAFPLRASAGRRGTIVDIIELLGEVERGASGDAPPAAQRVVR